MRYFSLLLFFIATCYPTLFYSQDVFDAVRVTSYQYSGTSRFNAMGGALGALGADISVINTNPGGLGLYRRNEVTFSPSIKINKTESSFNGNNSTDYVVNAKLENIGLVLNNPTGNNSGIISWTWAFGYNRISTLDKEYKIQNSELSSSMLDVFTYDLNYPSTIDPNDINSDLGLAYGSALAWNTYAIDYDTNYSDYYHANPGYEGTQYLEIKTSGSLSAYNFGFGANLNNELFFGASLDFNVYRYNIRTKYQEILPDQATYTDLSEFTYTNTLNISGSSTRLKLGVVYRANDYVRIGLAYHTPTKFKNTDTFEASAETLFNNGDEYNSESPVGQFLYTTRTPGRFIADLGFIIKKSGLLGIEYEFVDYSKVTFKDDEGYYDYSYENEQNKDELQKTHNFKVGAEFRKGAFSFRGGFRYQMSPFRNSTTINPILTYSSGIGFRIRYFYSDITWMMTQNNQQNWMYDSAFIDPYTTQTNATTLMLTVGIRWQ